MKRTSRQSGRYRKSAKYVRGVEEKDEVLFEVCLLEFWVGEFFEFVEGDGFARELEGGFAGAEFFAELLELGYEFAEGDNEGGGGADEFGGLDHNGNPDGEGTDDLGSGESLDLDFDFGLIDGI
jgi:hypothetical protein